MTKIINLDERRPGNRTPTYVPSGSCQQPYRREFRMKWRHWRALLEAFIALNLLVFLFWPAVYLVFRLVETILPYRN